MHDDEPKKTITKNANINMRLSQLTFANKLQNLNNNSELNLFFTVKRFTTEWFYLVLSRYIYMKGVSSDKNNSVFLMSLDIQQ